MNISSRKISQDLKALGDPAIAEHSQRFFKTAEGQYGHGDIFLGIRVPVIRKQVKKYRGITLNEVNKLLKSPYHEIRLCALLMLVELFAKGDDTENSRMYALYLKNTRHINNWDLVDLSAHHIVGAYLEHRNRNPLYTLARSASLWERRISVIATFYLIKKNDFADALKITQILKNDPEDLIHKAVGWMLREIGKRNQAVEERYLKRHYKHMPRTMLRYAIERFPEAKRKAYLEGRI
jgi:3-methyladenine DNA glycosylase AlkD